MPAEGDTGVCGAAARTEKSQERTAISLCWGVWGFFSAWGLEVGVILTGLQRIYQDVPVRRMGPSSFQCCPATGQGATGTN